MELRNAIVDKQAASDETTTVHLKPTLHQLCAPRTKEKSVRDTEMASLAGISGSWLTDGEMLHFGRSPEADSGGEWALNVETRLGWNG
uniref:Uncharacterized protein n=1 Tax=Knipowitschia caucasica TaxID=637954 RepID=A0AAV2L6V2_KNICA